jgi:hypothetical protein
VSFQALALGKIFLPLFPAEAVSGAWRGHHECKQARTARTASSLAGASESRDGLRSATPWRDGFDHERDDEQNPVEIVNRMPLFEPRGNRKPERKPRWVGKSK